MMETMQDCHNELEQLRLGTARRSALASFEENRRELHGENSIWTRLTSVSRRSLARIYGFLTWSRMMEQDSQSSR